MKIAINDWLSIDDSEIELDAIRAQGAGGQNVNKVSSAMHLRFDVKHSSLPERYKERLLGLKDKRITSEGVLVIKAQQFRTQLKNKEDALTRLVELIRSITVDVKPRRATRPSINAKRKRMDTKTKAGRVKKLRAKPSAYD